MNERIDIASDILEIPRDWIYCKITGLGKVTNPKNLAAFQDQLRVYIIVEPKENAVILCRRKEEDAPSIWKFLHEAKRAGAEVEFVTNSPEYEEIILSS